MLVDRWILAKNGCWKVRQIQLFGFVSYEQIGMYVLSDEITLKVVDAEMKHMQIDFESRFYHSQIHNIYNTMI